VRKIIFGSVLLSTAFFATSVNADFIGDITPTDAFHWASDDPNVYIIDVRTTPEWVLVGHPAANALVGSKNGKAKGMNYNEGGNLQDKVYHVPTLEGTPGVTMTPNPDFEDYIEEKFAPDDVLLFICRSGSRSTAAAIRVGALGYETYSILDGFEGPKNNDDDPGRDTGYRDVAGWVNEGLPYALTTAGRYNPTDGE
jgi:rhodanese-related sulfurtransferase